MKTKFKTLVCLSIISATLISCGKEDRLKSSAVFNSPGGEDATNFDGWDGGIFSYGMTATTTNGGTIITINCPAGYVNLIQTYIADGESQSKTCQNPTGCDYTNVIAVYAGPGSSGWVAREDTQDQGIVLLSSNNDLAWVMRTLQTCVPSSQYHYCVP